MFIAPFFCVFEILNFVFGYRQKEIENYAPIIEADIAHYRLDKGISMRKGISVKKN